MSVTLETFQRNTKIPLWLVIFFLIGVTISARAIWISVGTQFVVQNKTYTVTHTMNFHTITISDTYIVFNTTGFFVTSGNAITISLSFIHSNIAGVENGVKVLEF